MRIKEFTRILNSNARPAEKFVALLLFKRECPSTFKFALCEFNGKTYAIKQRIINKIMGLQ